MKRLQTFLVKNAGGGYAKAMKFLLSFVSDKTNLFPEIEKLRDKTVEVSGKIMAYRKRPQIILTNTNQLKVIERPNESEKK